MSKAILILGATGKQGGSVLRALLSSPTFSPKDYTIYAATRDPSSASAQRLAALSPSIKPVLGDLRSPAAAFAKLPSKPWAAFLVTYPGKTEQADGIGAVDAAIAAGVSHIVFSSVDRGVGSPATTVPHFITKHNIEAHLKAKSQRAGSTFTYTIIRPPFFLDNLEPSFLGKIMATLWRDHVTSTTPLTVIATSDIGVFGASALLNPHSPTYRNAEFDIAGDALTFAQANAVFREKTGGDIPTTNGMLASAVPFLMGDIRKMFEFFNESGFAASPEETNRVHRMADFGEWVGRSKHVSRSV